MRLILSGAVASITALVLWILLGVYLCAILGMVQVIASATPVVVPQGVAIGLARVAIGFPVVTSTAFLLFLWGICNLKVGLEAKGE